MDNINIYDIACSLLFVPCNILDNGEIYKNLKDLSNRFIQLRNEDKDKDYLSYRFDVLILKIKNGGKINDCTVREMNVICRALGEKEQESVGILRNYQSLIDANIILKNYPWNNKVFDYPDIQRYLTEEIVARAVRIKVFDQLGDIFFSMTLSNEDKVMMWRAGMYFLNALTLCLYSDKVFAAWESLEAIGKLFRFDVNKLPILTDACSRACLRLTLLPYLENGYQIVFRRNPNRTDADSVYLQALKGVFAEIAFVVEQHYGNLDQVNAWGIHVPDCFFNETLDG